MTVAEFYQAHAHDGRAVIAGDWQSPERWIVRLRGVGGVGYFLCGADVTDKVAQVDGTMDVEKAARVSLLSAASKPVGAEALVQRKLRAEGRCVRCRRPWTGYQWKCGRCRAAFNAARQNRAAQWSALQAAGGVH